MDGQLLVRNGLLAGIAGFVVWQGRLDAGGSALGWVGDLTTAERTNLLLGILSLGVAATTLWLLIQMLGQQGRVLLRLDSVEAKLTTNGIEPNASISGTLTWRTGAGGQSPQTPTQRIKWSIFRAATNGKHKAGAVALNDAEHATLEKTHEPRGGHWASASGFAEVCSRRPVAGCLEIRECAVSWYTRSVPLSV